MQMVIPRSREHWVSLKQKFGTTYFSTVPGIYKPSDGGNYTSVAMNSKAMPEGGYRALDGGEWWLRDTPFEQPDGNYW